LTAFSEGGFLLVLTSGRNCQKGEVPAKKECSKEGKSKRGKGESGY